MKTWKKLAILAMALGALLLLATGSNMAGSRVQRIVVYTYTQSNNASFTANQQVPGWSWSININELYPGTRAELRVYDDTAQQLVLDEATYEDTGGSISIVEGHDYRVWTQPGQYSVPGRATCVVVNANWNPDLLEE